MQKYTKEEVLSFITLIRKTFGRYSEDSGGCYKFYLILKKVFDGRGFYNSNHVITKIGDVYFDIDGEVIRHKGFIPVEEFGEEHMEESFKQHI